MATWPGIAPRIALAVVTSIGSAGVAYLRARAESKVELEESSSRARGELEMEYVALKVAVEAQGKAMEQMQRGEAEWHALVARLLAQDHRAPTAPATLEQLRRPPPQFAAKPLPPALDDVLRAAAAK